MTRLRPCRRCRLSPSPAGAAYGEQLPTGAFHIPDDARMAQFIGGAPPPGNGRHRYVIGSQALDIEKVAQIGVQADSTPAWFGFGVNVGGHVLGRGVVTP